MATAFTFYAATVVFVVTYVLISLRNVRRFPIERPAVAMLGGALMLVLGILTPAEAIAAINLDVILLLVGMMILVSGLDACGFFDLVSSRIAARAKTQTSFLVWLMVTTAALSAVVLNDTIALLVTPVVVRSARALRVNPIPYLVAVAISANVGSVATEVGNPQNAFIGIRSGIPFLTFTAYLLPVTVACLAVAIGLVWLAFRKDLAAPLTPAVSMPAATLQRRGMVFTLAVTLAVAVAFFASSTPEWLPLIALAGGSFVLFFLPFVSKATPRSLIAKVDWSIILFFVGLFILLEGIRVSGLSGAIQDGFTSAFAGRSGGLPWLVGLSALLSNLISNVPAVLLLAQVVPQGSTQLWLGLATSSTLAGNATILGAACNVIVVQVASRDGVTVSMRDFVKAGLPVTAATLVLSTFLVALLVPA
ncbi:MAG: arsenic ABC transporter [Methanobacteriota archaeon]|nr:MAG: arsenic ABC transporter [Euryarchaeota archaeon]